MLATLLSLPIFFLIGFYAWAMISVHGVVQGLHVSALAISFFIITTPLLAQLFVFNCLPRFLTRSFGGLGIFMIWISCMLLNLFTLLHFPKLYANWPITKISFETLMTPFTRNATLAISFGALLYHWIVAKLESRWLKLWFHVVGLVVFNLLFYLIIPAIRDVLIVVFNAGNENF